ncbi:DUF413 domain-containing protein [Vibrio sp. WXL210]|uniref:DUF413 domain-containing protein n=1 Tax=Vibrio sp. WXL210 TaxID=3450709 RepID=UPI003EC763B6
MSIKLPPEHRKLLETDFYIPRELESFLTYKEIEDIEIYGSWLSALEFGRIKPVTLDQKDFLKVLNGDGAPKTKLQETWIKWRKIRRKRISCRLCIGKGFYTNPKTNEVETCSDCHGTGQKGLTSTKISAEGSY